jgi:hypothetical protein
MGHCAFRAFGALLACERLDDDRRKLTVIARDVAEHGTLECQTVQDMLDPAAADRAIDREGCPFDARLPGVRRRDLAFVDLVVDIVVRPCLARIHVTERMANLLVGREAIPDRQRRMRRVDTPLQISKLGQQGPDAVGTGARIVFHVGEALDAGGAVEPVGRGLFRAGRRGHGGMHALLRLARAALAMMTDKDRLPHMEGLGEFVSAARKELAWHGVCARDRRAVRP